MSDPGPLPLVIGVTGHRDLRDEDRAALEAAVRGVLASLRQRYPHSSLLLLSPLAEGADRLAARVALTEGARLIVPLPLPQAIYEADFATQESVAEFRALLARAEAQVELPLPAGCVPEHVAGPGAPRDQQYEFAGAYVVTHSQILLALWDGEQAELAGGTAQMVRFQLEGVPEPFAPPRGPIDEPDVGPVYHVVTPRVKNPVPTGTPFAVRLILPVEETDQEPGDDELGDFGRVYARADQFNRDAARLAAPLAAQRAQSRDQLLQGRDPTAVPEALRTPLALFVEADSLAVHYKRQTGHTLIVLFLLAFLAVATFNIYAELLRYPQTVAVYLFVLLAAYVWYLWAGDSSSPPGLLRGLLGAERAARVWAGRGDYRSKYLDYRALAEGMRVQFYWRLAGVDSSVADHYLRKQRSELDWIRNAARIAEVPTAAARATRLDAPDYERVLVEWVEDQRNFYIRATGRDRALLHRKDRLVASLFGLGILVAAILVVVAPLLEHELEGLPHHLLVILAGLSPVAAGLREGYAEKQALAEEAKQYQQMGELFVRAARQLRALLPTGTPTDLASLVRAIGREALAENGDWVLLQRSRPLEVPK